MLIKIRVALLFLSLYRSFKERESELARSGRSTIRARRVISRVSSATQGVENNIISSCFSVRFVRFFFFFFSFIVIILIQLESADPFVLPAQSFRFGYAFVCHCLRIISTCARDEKRKRSKRWLWYRYDSLQS